MKRNCKKFANFSTLFSSLEGVFILLTNQLDTTYEKAFVGFTEIIFTINNIITLSPTLYGLRTFFQEISTHRSIHDP